MIIILNLCSTPHTKVHYLWSIKLNAKKNYKNSSENMRENIFEIVLDQNFFNVTLSNDL